MPYDPQRSHRRPRLADDSPAPIDALLGDDREPAGLPDAHESNGDRPEPVVRAEVAPGPDAEPVRAASSDVEGVEASLPSPSRRARPLAVVAAAVLVMLLVLAWVRRRR